MESPRALLAIAGKTAACPVVGLAVPVAGSALFPGAVRLSLGTLIGCSVAARGADA